ncbi:hypothetical protein Tco_1363325 [Tanacetum coccineum]
MIGHFDKKQAYLDMESPINVMSRLHYNWIMSKRLGPRRKPSNPGKICNFVGRVKGLKVFVGNFSYTCDFVVLEDTTSVIDHDLGSVIFEKPFVEATGLVYNREEGTIMFEKDKEKIVFKMPHKIEMFKHIDFTNVKTDRIPPFAIESDDDSSRKTHYSDSLDLGPEYKHDENVGRAIRSLIAMKAKRNKGEIWYDEDVHDLRSVETEFPAIVFNDNLSSNETLFCEPTVSSLNDNEIDFRISFDESEDEDYTVIFEKNSFSYKIIFANDLKIDSENDNEKVNMPLFLSPEPLVSCIDDIDFFTDFENEFPAIVYNDALTSKSDFSTEPTLCPQHIDEFDLQYETSLLLDTAYSLNEYNIFDFYRSQYGDLLNENDDVGLARQEGNTGGVDEEASVAPGGGNEDEEMPQGQREVLDSMTRDLSRFTTWTVTSLSWMMYRAGVTYTRYSESPVEYQRTKTGSKFSTIVHDDLAEKEIDNVGEVSTICKSESVGVLKLQDGCST